MLGDGVSTLGDLIAEENRRRLAARGGAGLALLRADLDAVLTLEAAGLDLRSVPPFGTAVRIKTATNESGPRDNATIREPLSPELVAEARRAAGAVGLRLAGVDVITPNCGRSLAESGGVINEVNGHPALHHHYQVVDPPAATRVAVPILRRLLGGEAGKRGPVSGNKLSKPL